MERVSRAIYLCILLPNLFMLIIAYGKAEYKSIH